MIFFKVLIIFLAAPIVFSGYKEDWIAAGKASQQAENCRPFGIRLSWGLSVFNPSSSEKLQIRFNTLKRCQSTGVLLNGQVLINCMIGERSKFSTSFAETFNSFTHICSLSEQISFGSPFSYNIFEQNTLNSYLASDIKVKLNDPRDIERTVKFINFADWGKINYKKGILPQVVNAVNNLISKQEIEAVIVNGDIAYDLTSDLDHHLQFMEMMEKISKHMPIIVNRGNHQNGEAGVLFCQYFQVYELCQRNATGLSIGPAFLALFDPQLALIPRLYTLYSRQAILSSKINLVSELERGSKSGRAIIAFSHYPLICSYPTTYHCIPASYYNELYPLYINLQQHYNVLLDYRVPLILSGHVHTYERSHKMKRGYRFQPFESSKNQTILNNKGQSFLVHVVDGVAGSDTYLYSNYELNGVKQEVQPFVASINLGAVGFGVITVSPSAVEYQHFGVNLDDSITSLDYFKINLDAEISAQSNEDQL